jgi:hypothetical protein
MQTRIDNSINSQINEFNNLLQKFGKDAEKILVQSIRIGLKDFLKDLKNNAPVSTGATKRSLGIISRKNRVTIGLRPGLYGTNEGNIQPRFYGRVEEQRKPWFEPTWNRHEPTIENKIIDSLEPAMIQVAKNIEKRVSKKLGKR